MSRLLDWAGLAVIVLVGFGLWVFWSIWDRKRADAVLDTVIRENKAIDEKARVQKLEAEMGRDKALAEVESTHAEALEKLDAEQKATADHLRRNPPSLAKFLVRSAR